MSSRLDDQNRLVDAIYDGAERPEGFGGVLERLARSLGASFAHELLISLDAGSVENHSFGYDESSFAEYARDWRDKDPRFAAAIARPSEVLSDVAVIDSDAFERSAIYNEHLARSGMRYTLFGTFRAAPNLMVATAFMRTRAEGAFGPQEIARASEIAPHLVRAARLRHIVHSLRDELSDLRVALDTVAGAVAILDRRGTILCANAAAETLLRRRDGVHTENGALSAVDPVETEALHAAIARAVASADAGKRAQSAHRAACVTVSRTVGAPVAVSFTTLRPRSAVRHEVRGARVLAVFHDPNLSVRIEPELAAQLHGLSATEALLASALAEGRTLAQFAEARGCTEQTARTHLKRVFDKTHTKRQAELVRVLLTSAARRRVL
jgi:DNA-binding CsgD family transcriptional regulator